ncbi:metalloendopeptidase OMA1, mitochondrial [Vanacampus margaritifer]
MMFPFLKGLPLSHLTRQLQGCSRSFHIYSLRTPHRLRHGAARAGRPVLMVPHGTTGTVLSKTPCRLQPPLCGAQFRTSARVKALPAPLFWMVLKPVQKLMAMILGRSVRKWWVALPDNRRELFRQWVWQQRWRLVALAGTAAAITALLLLTHLDQSPVTGRTRLLVFSRQNYMELAAFTSEAYMEEFGKLLLPESDPRHQAVERVVQHLARRNQNLPEMADVDWTVHVVQSDNANAFVLPNGKVFMFTGMLEAVADVHQLTIVLGHEMAHALLGHAAEQASLSHVVDLLSVVLLAAIWTVCPRDSLALLGQWVQEKLTQLMFNRPYSRKLEAEADEVGLQLAAKACADVRAGPVFWQQMEIREQLSGEPSLPEWLSTHPSHKNRVAQLDRLVPQALELRERCMCPTLPPTDPRAVFSKSVRVLLEDAKTGPRPVRGGTPQHGPTGVAAPAALLAQSSPLFSSSVSQADNKALGGAGTPPTTPLQNGTDATQGYKDTGPSVSG